MSGRPMPFRSGDDAARAAVAPLLNELRGELLVLPRDDVADLSVADTAHVLGKKPGAVKTTHRRALAALASRVSGKAVR